MDYKRILLRTLDILKWNSHDRHLLEMELKQYYLNEFSAEKLSKESYEEYYDFFDKVVNIIKNDTGTGLIGQTGNKPSSSIKGSFNAQEN